MRLLVWRAKVFVTARAKQRIVGNVLGFARKTGLAKSVVFACVFLVSETATLRTRYSETFVVEWHRLFFIFSF